jgi:hypothetical protein
LIAFTFHTVPNKWPHFLSATVDALQMGSQIYGIPINTINLTILEFLTLVPEEVTGANLSGGRK